MWKSNINHFLQDTEDSKYFMLGGGEEEGQSASLNLEINGIHMQINQGNLRGESVVAAILPSRMEVRYCISAFFHARI